MAGRLVFQCLYDDSYACVTDYLSIYLLSIQQHLVSSIRIKQYQHRIDACLCCKYRCPYGGSNPGLYGCNLLGYNLPTDQFPNKTTTEVQMVGGQGGVPGYVSKCGTSDMVYATTIKIYTDKETHPLNNCIDQVTVYWSDNTNNR